MQELFDLTGVLFADLIDTEKPWLSLQKISDYIEANRENLINKGFKTQGKVLLHPNSSVDPSVTFNGSALIDDGAEISKNALIRDGLILGKNSFIGIGLEIKRSIILNSTRVPHLSYIADSILGSNVNIGAGTITANWKGGWDDKIINLSISGQRISTGQEKFGALIGDNVYLGSNNVTSPGTIIGKNVLTYPLCFLRGEIPENTIVKNKSNQEIVPRK